ncbi:MAG: imidazole glycerol phosphate synthase subunit HisH [Vicinamibacterales bacterium]
MITIVDYGLGNVNAFLNVYRRLNVAARTATRADDLHDAAKVILPGVGAFDHAMARLTESGMRSALDDAVLRRRVPLLGVCVGMQMLGRYSDEGRLPGLGWIEGQVRSLASVVATRPVPHMGWNDARPIAHEPLFARLESPRFYFLHSYYFQCDRAEDTIALADYGGEFACAVRADNVYGVQFHPEKSHHDGVQLLKNFAEI